jgi:hypothetical protein
LKTDTGNSLSFNLDNLLLSIKNTHSNALKVKNEELFSFLQSSFIKLTQKGGDSSPLASLLKSNPDLHQGKNGLKHLVQAVLHLSSPNYAPNFPCSDVEIQEEIDTFFAVKEEVLQLLLAGFVLQTLIGV